MEEIEFVKAEWQEAVVELEKMSSDLVSARHEVTMVKEAANVELGELRNNLMMAKKETETVREEWQS